MGVDVAQPGLVTLISQRKLLFVDDEPSVVRGLKLALHQYRDRWQVETRTSAAEAVEALERGPFDALVTDARMPGMDGEALLRVASERWPTTLRVVLSGEPGREGLERLTRLAHHCFSKPVTITQLHHRIEDSLVARERLSSPVVRELVCKLGSLPAMPATYAAISQLSSKETSDLAEFVNVVERDASVCGALLRAVNSAWFAPPTPVKSVHDAVRLLGLRQLRSLVLASEVFGGSTAAVDALRRDAIQRLSVTPKFLELINAQPWREEFATAAVLVDVGQLALHSGLPKEAAAIDALVAAGADRSNVERHRLGADHALIGGVLLDLWGLPRSLLDAVTLHHDVHEGVPTLASALALLCETQTLAQGTERAEPAVRALAAIHGVPDIAPLRGLFDAAIDS